MRNIISSFHYDILITIITLLRVKSQATLISWLGKLPPLVLSCIWPVYKYIVCTRTQSTIIGAQCAYESELIFCAEDYLFSRFKINDLKIKLIVFNDNSVSVFNDNSVSYLDNSWFSLVGWDQVSRTITMAVA